ncbi:purine-nucleoside phosphorylase [soil metagenome]
MTDSTAAVAEIRRRTPLTQVVGIVLGSGLSRLAADVRHPVRIPYTGIPGWRPCSVPGHAGELVVGTLADRPVAVMNGRLHYYEGHEMDALTFPIRVFRAWGAMTVILTNAAGGLNPSYRAGDLMVVSDHLNFMPASPLRGLNDDALGSRFPDMVDAYTPELRSLAHSVDDSLREGVYVAVPGPNFETPAELRMLRGWGADAVGMSTVPEVIVARHAGMRVLAISTITDMATGIPGQIEHVHHEQVLAVANAAGARLARVVTEVVARL